MIGSVSKKFVAGLLIFAFVGIILISIQFMNGYNKESFTNTTEKQTSRTRSIQCNCLPGYVAAKNTNTSIYFCQNLSDSSKTRNCY